jgi:hypothetical protein
MSDLAQHAVVWIVVAACVAYVARQAMRTLAGRRGKIGNCCATGCGEAKPQQAGGPRVAYLPASMLTRKGKSPS